MRQVGEESVQPPGGTRRPKRPRLLEGRSRGVGLWGSATPLGQGGEGVKELGAQGWSAKGPRPGRVNSPEGTRELSWGLMAT
jgi:hypothetical protein